ncbi:hypothetical protein HJ590_10165 [Naumannella sp. ID2617S]|nr:hypothetical protein [Naumannella sp. ID2617S]
MSLSSPRPASRATLARAVVAGTASLALGLTGVALGTSRADAAPRFGSSSGMTVSLYAGSKQELYEQGAGWSTHTFSGALTRAGVQHRWDMYGQPGQVGRYNCDGGHNFGCWNMALNKDLPRLMGAIA